MYVVGLTGGICAGKSAISRVLQARGAMIIDADLLGHEAYRQNTPCYERLVAHFGADNILSSESKEIDRKRLGGIVFSDSEQMNQLQNIVWPEIRKLIEQKLQSVEETDMNAVVVLEAAVMLEAKWQDMVSTLWVPFVSRDTARTRLMQRNGLSAEEAEKRIDVQMSNEERLRFANVSVNNDGITHEELESCVSELCVSNPHLNTLLGGKSALAQAEAATAEEVAVAIEGTDTIK